MRFRGDQRAVVAPINELPLMFGDDAEIMSFYGAMLSAANVDERTRALRGLVIRLSSVTKMPAGLEAADVEAYLLVPS